MMKIKEDIISIVNKIGITTESVYTTSKLARHARIRNVIVYILSESYGYSIKEIAQEINKDYSTVYNSIRRIKNTEDKHIKFLLKEYYG